MLLIPRDDGIDLAESKAKKKIVSESQKRSGDSLVGQPATRTVFIGDEETRMLKKRLAEGEASHDLSEEEDIDVSLMEALEDAEEQTLHMVSLDYCLPMITCEEPVDVSFLNSEHARGLSDAIGCSRVGEVRHLLDRRLNQCMMAELCGETLTNGLGSIGEVDVTQKLGESIFDHASQMGVVPGELSDHWDRDPLTATWTRSVVVPRRTFFHPSEGENGPDLSVLSGGRTTLLSAGKMVRDNWKPAAVDDGPSNGEPWTGKCTFYELWEDASQSLEEGEPTNPLGCVIQLLQGFEGQVENDDVGALDLPGRLVFTNVEEYSLKDDLSGDPLDGALVTIAKRE